MHISTQAQEWDQQKAEELIYEEKVAGYMCPPSDECPICQAEESK